jgi:hypothetical protein
MEFSEYFYGYTMFYTSEIFDGNHENAMMYGMLDWLKFWNSAKQQQQQFEINFVLCSISFPIYCYVSWQVTANMVFHLLLQWEFTNNKMAIFSLLSAVAGFVKVRFLIDKAVIDNMVFRFHYRITCAILFVCCILCTTTSLIGGCKSQWLLAWTVATAKRIAQIPESAQLLIWKVVIAE